MEEINLALIQEPWVRNDKVLGLNCPGADLVYARGIEKPRTCIMVNKRLNYVPVLEHCSRDLTTVKLLAEETSRQILMASVYLPYDDDARNLPSIEVCNLVEFANSERLGLILCCDSNSHNVVWGSSDTNVRGKLLLDYIVSSKLEICNIGNEPTFMTRVRKEVIDITLCSFSVTRLISNWHVSGEPSLSDHKHIVFNISNIELSQVLFRNPRRTDWDSFRDELGNSLEGCSGRVCTSRELDRQAGNLREVIVSAFEAHCPVSTKKNSSVNWWSPQLASLRKRVRSLFKASKATGRWDAYHRLLTEYNKEVRRAKRESWRNFCSDIAKEHEASRLRKVLAKEPLSPAGLLKNQNGEYIADPNETLAVLLGTHFPGCLDGNVDGPRANRTGGTRGDWNMARRIVTWGRIRWAVHSFSPYKSPGGDEIRPICLQVGIESLLPILCKLFRASLALSHIPHSWRQTRVVFIPKVGRLSYSDPKSFRPISLMSFLLKTLEKIVLRHIWEKALVDFPFHVNQHAYITGRSCDSALHHLVCRIEKTLEEKEIALGAFLDIEGVFDNTCTDIIEESAKRLGFDDLTCRWISSMLRGRLVSATLLGCSKTVTTTRGCPQGGVLSPLLWNLVVDGLIRIINDSGVYAQAYADDVVILVSGKFAPTVTELLSGALGRVSLWCEQVGLTVNPRKSTVVPFTNRRKLEGLGPVIMQGEHLELSNQVKYLGVILDRKLNWGPQLKRVTDRGKWTLMTCRRVVGRSWGLKPRIMLWLYTAVVRPALTYGAVVWWPRVQVQVAAAELAGVQRLAGLTVTGAFCSTPGATLDSCLNIPPLDIYIRSVARKCAYRLQSGNTWKGTSHGHARITQMLEDCVLDMFSDQMKVCYSFSKPFKVIIPDRQEWLSSERPIPPGELEWYTDGSKSEEGTGAGIWGERPGREIIVPMGKYHSVFQSEVAAILRCAQENLMLGYRNKVISIFSDSQAALKALDSFEFKSRLVWDCYSFLAELGRCNMVTLCWIPGHSGFEGNEKADALANSAAATLLEGPQPFCGIPRSSAYQSINSWVRNEHERRWHQVHGHRMSKMVLSRPSATVASELMQLSRGKLRLVLGLISGHCGLRLHLRRLGAHDGATSCRKCGLYDETAEHILFDCNGLKYVRTVVFGKLTKGSRIPEEGLVRKIQKFLELSGLFR